MLASRLGQTIHEEGHDETGEDASAAAVDAEDGPKEPREPGPNTLKGAFMRTMLRSSSRRHSLLLSAVLVAAVGAVATAQFGFPGHQEPSVRNPAYDGRFAFARIRYTTAPGG